jgi:predicted transcriptional regulator
MPRDASLPILTRAETEVMRVLWAKGSGTVHEVARNLPRELAYTTVLTMMRVLEQKGYLTHEPSPDGGRAHVYRPTMAEDGVRRSHVRDFVERLFGGHADELVIGLLRDEHLKREDLEGLRAEIDAMLEKNKATRRRK